ncbi:hypothetical protein MRB53_042235 [Persea americana]|nr:hypothetical protein MRB53_042235 [Persea americana]
MFSPYARSRDSSPASGASTVIFHPESPAETGPLTWPWPESETAPRINLADNASGSYRQRHRSSSITTNPYEPFEAPPTDAVHFKQIRSRSGRFSKYSPTPSIKRGKAEKLLREHGSPPGVRVTAGGRIVPNGLSPLASPRFEQFAGMQDNARGRVLPRYSPSTVPPGMPNGFLFEAGNGICQVVNGELRPVENRDGLLQLHMQASNFTNAAWLNPFMPSGVADALPAARSERALPGQAGNNFDPATFQKAPDERQYRIMQAHHDSLERDLKELDRQEVLQRDNLTPLHRADIVKQRRALITTIDQSRKALIRVRKLLDGDEVPGEDEKEPALQPRNNLNLLHHPSNLGGWLHSGDFDAVQAPVFVGPALDYTGHNGMVLPHYATSYGFPQPTGSGSIGAFDSSQWPLPAREGSLPLSQRDMNITSSPRASRDSVGNPGPITNAALGNDDVMRVKDKRRSHAIQIKQPDDYKGSAVLDPRSPIYGPPQTTLQRAEPLAEAPFIPSPSLIARMDDLVLSPTQALRQPQDEAGSTGNVSKSSASTGDFFPNDAAKHSIHRYDSGAHQGNANLPAWLANDSLPSMHDTQRTPARVPNKFVYHDSPDGQQIGFNSLSQSETSQRCSNVQEEATARRDYSSTSGPSTSTIVITPQSAVRTEAVAAIASNTIEQGPWNPATLNSANSEVKSEAYHLGYAVGSQQTLFDKDRAQDDNYRLGYRDGLLASAAARPWSPFGAPSADVAGLDSLLPTRHTLNASESGPANTASSALPAAPANSLVSSPQQGCSAFDSTSLSIGQQTSSHPSTTVLPASSELAPAKLSLSDKAGEDLQLQHSPLAMRLSGNQMSPPKTTFDKQRFDMRKTAPTSAQSMSNAKGWVPQYDGSNDDAVSAEARADASRPGPSTKATLSAQAATIGSPVKALSPGKGCSPTKLGSPVKSAIALFSTSSKHRDEPDPSKMSSPEKKQWREMWRKHFSDKKLAEQKDIEAYKEAHPI